MLRWRQTRKLGHITYFQGFKSSHEYFDFYKQTSLLLNETRRSSVYNSYIAIEYMHMYEYMYMYM